MITRICGATTSGIENQTFHAPRENEKMRRGEII